MRDVAAKVAFSFAFGQKMVRKSTPLSTSFAVAVLDEKKMMAMIQGKSEATRDLYCCGAHALFALMEVGGGQFSVGLFQASSCNIHPAFFEIRYKTQ